MPQDYRKPIFAATDPYQPTAAFAGLGKGKDLSGLPWRVGTDYLGVPLRAGHKPSMGAIEFPEQ